MSWELIFVLAAMTYASRGLALAAMPALPHAARMVLDRVPPALFAGLAANSLLVAGGGVADGETLAAAAAALLVAPRRSLPLCLVAGVAAYIVAGLLL